MSPTGSLVLLYFDILYIRRLLALSLWPLHSTRAVTGRGLSRGCFIRPNRHHFWQLQVLSLWHFIHGTPYWPLVGLTYCTVRKYLVGSRCVVAFTVFTVEDRVDNIYSSEEGFRALYRIPPALHSPHIHTWQPNSSVCHCNGHFFAAVNTLISPTNQGTFCTGICNYIKRSNILSSGRSFSDVFLWFH